MKLSTHISLVASVVFLCFSCTNKVENTNLIEGLWLVEKVKIGEKERTPIARWMQFYKDSTQVSGNGWLKHSVGTWHLNQKKHLKITNTNGLLDDSEPFLIAIAKNTMTWTRKEENQKVQVFLKRIAKRPTSKGNKLMGLWQLVNYQISNKDVTATENPKNNQTLYLSWDNVFREHHLLTGRKVGVYKIHGHKPELQMVNYGENPQFSFWKFSFEKEALILKSTNGKIIKKYRRIYKFLQ